MYTVATVYRRQDVTPTFLRSTGFLARASGQAAPWIREAGTELPPPPLTLLKGPYAPPAPTFLPVFPKCRATSSLCPRSTPHEVLSSLSQILGGPA